MLTRSMEASEKHHDENDALIRDQQALMRDQQALLRNHQASIKNIEAQLSQLTTLVNERLPPPIPDNKPPPHVMAITTEEDTTSEFLEALEEETKQSESQPKRMKIEDFFSEIPSS